MEDFIRRLFNSDFMPHGHCFLWQPSILWLHVISDATIALSYYLIPFALLYLVRRRRDLIYPSIFVLFGLFILSCGTTHLMSIWTMWNPTYRLEGVIKAITALSSFVTAMAMLRIVPQALQIPSRRDLEIANEKLAEENRVRVNVEKQVRQLNQDLEKRVEDRTRALSAANERLKETEKLLRQMINAMPQLAWTAGPDGAPDYFNLRWYEYTGTTPEQSLGERWVTVLHPEDQEGAAERWRESVQTGEDYDIEYRLRRAVDGSFRWFLGRARPLYDDSGRVARWFGTCTDIHDQKASQEELRSRNDDLNQFAYAASHDLQEPLRMISIYSELLRSRHGDLLDGDAALYLQFVLDGVHRMESLLQDLLAYSRAGGEKDLPTLAPVDSNEVLDHAISILTPLIGENGALIEHGALPVVRMRETHLLQLFQNLLSNAIKYRSAEQPRIVVNCYRAESEYVFCIRDNGVGIPPEYHEQVFGIFKRLHGREVPGTGIGLAICRKIVERYGGHMWVESPEGGGALFCFSVPV
jgi:PAS domain S-box-containing protein